MSIFVGILLLVGGTLIVIKTEWLLQNFGRIAWFEAKLGSEGGSRLGYKLIGVAFIIIGIISLTGSGQGFAEWIFSPLLKYNK